MKKIVGLALCLVLVFTMLVSCDEQNIGDGIGHYPETQQTVERLDLNMYIITGDESAKAATDAVATRISGYTKITYNTVLNITYLTESEYEEAVVNAINAGGNKAPHIVLINSESLFDKLMEGNKLADLTSYYWSRDYGRLNTQITSSLIEKSYVGDKIYTVPNNRVVGEYTYLAINKDVAMKTLKYTNSELSSYKSLEDAAALMAEMDANGFNSADYVKIVKGPYELRETLEVENFCNIVDVPTVTRADAFASAFAVVNNSQQKYNDRAMNLIYAINNDLELRNFLQYGVVGANFELVDGDIVRIKTGNSVYDMDLTYTGDTFKADNCSELGWTDAKKGYGILQNKDSKVEAEVEAE